MIATATATNVLLLVGAVILFSLAVLYVVQTRATDGYEDSTGFHTGADPRRPNWHWDEDLEMMDWPDDEDVSDVRHGGLGR